MLAGLDAVVIDLQDVGVRFYTYATTMAYILEEAAKRKLKVFVLDRPNPIGAAGVRGPLPDPDVKSFTNYFRLPVQHGMTLGELGRLFNAERRIGADLTVIAMQGYVRASWYDETGLAWVAPSPNLRSLVGTALYPGVGLIEDTNVSVGRGTPTPFEVVGAPWMDGAALAAALQRRGIAGVRFASVAFTPTASRYAGRRCNGIRIELTDRTALDASRLGIELAVALRKLHPDRFAVRDMFRLLASREILAAIEAGEDPAAIERRWQPGLRAFMSCARSTCSTDVPGVIPAKRSAGIRCQRRPPSWIGRSSRPPSSRRRRTCEPIARPPFRKMRHALASCPGCRPPPA